MFYEQKMTCLAALNFGDFGESRKRPKRGQKRPRRGPEEARKRPEEAGRGQEEAGRGLEEARRGSKNARNPEFGEKLLETHVLWLENDVSGAP